jgi:non-ribosomal peptide synthetase component E (peptide arylation enzyme)
MALGYAHEEDNATAYDEDGYFRMGDLGRIVDEKYIVITGRKKDLIIRAGENISPKEIEDVLFEHPKIAEVAIVSMPSKKTGEAICAFVIPAENKKIDIVEISHFLRDAGLARQKTPEHVELVEDLPRTASGKVRKDLLREAAKAFAI